MNRELEIIFKQFSKDHGGAVGAIDYMRNLRDQFSSALVTNLLKSKSQIGQDVFVLSETNFKRDGFFVEFGATNGVDLSNTHILEKEFDWTGILAEPGKVWHEALRQNRSCAVDAGCVWSESGSTLRFNQTSAAEYSTIDEYSSLDGHAGKRKNGESYDVSTISLRDLLRKYDAPKTIDYLSIDTEGSEFEILNNFDFAEYQFNVITCEHNFTPERAKLYLLLTANGYERKFEDLSRFDDWYVKAELT
jgi:FkbM family methyltransferase